MNVGTYVLLALLCIFIRLHERGRRKQRELPSTGFRSIWGSYLKSVSNVFRSNAAVKEACLEFGGRLFSFPLLGEWCVMVKERAHVQDHYHAQEEVLSMEAAAEELLQLRYTVGDKFCDETYHIPAIRGSLNACLAAKIPELLDEIAQSFRDEIDSSFHGRADGEWIPVKASTQTGRIITRASNRVFVGLPLCRDTEYCNIVRNFSNTVITGGAIIRMLVPKFLRPTAGKLFRLYFRHHDRIVKLLKPLIEEHRHQRSGWEAEKTSKDMLDWLMDTETEGIEHSIDSIAMRMLNVNFVALHTTTKAFVHALYHLASKPHYIPILRDEARQYLDPSDPLSWTREALNSCLKLDSFLKECLRLNGLGAIWMPRLTLGTFEFSDGTTVKPGNFVATAVTAIHEDESNYQNAKEFDGLRFYKMIHNQSDDSSESHLIETDSDGRWMHRLTGASPTYLTFGGGRHICPGRFFASLEMKSMMAYLLFHYDMKMPGEGIRPNDEWLGPTSNPATDAIILFRRRIE